MDKHKIIKEKDELERVVQDLSRNEGVEISYDELFNAFKRAQEVQLSNDVWSVLENTESTEIQKGDIDAVRKVAHMYHKTNPNILAKAIKSGEYDRPMILNYDGDKYHLVAGNTRLCTAKALGIKPYVYMASIDTKNTEMKETENLKGGLADGKTLADVAKKHKMDVDLLKIQLQNGIKVEKEEHTDSKKTAKEIALDHLWENPTYYIDLKKADIDETGADSAGAFEGPFGGTGGVILKKDIHKLKNLPNAKSYNVNEAKKPTEEEFTEATTADVSASGAYDTPFGGGGPKGRKNPLKIDGPDSIYKGRAVKDKNFPRFGGPGGVYVKVKDKCKKFPYCNQGDTNALEFIHEAIEETAKKHGVSYQEIEKIVLKEINRIFI